MARGGLSESRLRQLHEIMAGHVARGAVPGLVALVSRQGEAHVDVIGMMAVDGDQPMRRDTIFRIASTTKPIAAAAAMILVEECKLRLDEPVDALLPELANRRVLRRLDSELDDTVPANRPITPRDLLTFTLGIGMIFEPDAPPIQKALYELHLGFEPDPHQVPAPDEWMRRLGSLPLMYQPGERWLYNIGYDVLGVLIARAAGQDLETFLRQRLFDPLGMHDTRFSVPGEKRGRLAAQYFTDPQSGALTLFDEAGDTRWARQPAFLSGAGGLVSTADDLLAFGQMMLNDGRFGDERILSRPSLELMMSDQLTPAQKAFEPLVPGYWESHGWGFGGSVVTRRNEIANVPGKYGWDGGTGTSWYVDPAEEMVTVLLTQAAFTSANPPLVVRDFWTAAYQAIDD
jgi:CubicO group peptidase (beta-lactamase class C family)